MYNTLLQPLKELIVAVLLKTPQANYRSFKVFKE
jgi:hypothetical protein